jgi:hypothetical protein
MKNKPRPINHVRAQKSKELGVSFYSVDIQMKWWGCGYADSVLLTVHY